MPQPGKRESEQDFIRRCIPIVIEDGTAEDGSQGSAICHSIWREARKSNMTPNELLLAEINSRQEKRTEFNYGILTADRYVKTVQDCVGSEICYRYACTKSTSFDDVLKKSTKTLTYNNPEMKTQDIYDLTKFHRLDINDDQIELPKNTLMVFRHILTTPRKDRDGDILRTKGATVDPNMLLLWNHVHTLPTGKMLGIAEHSSKLLSLFSAIIDMNELCHDAAVMIDNKMGRFSHGFRALDFDKMKEEEGRTTSPGGFDIKLFEIMEESIVTVPSNTDSETQEILLSLVEGGKLTSPIMKSFGKSIREHRPVLSSVKYNEKIGDFERTIETSNAADFETIFKTTGEKNNEDKSRDGSSETKGEGCGCGTVPCSCSSKETNDDNTINKSRETEDSKVKSMVGPTDPINGHTHQVTLDNDGNGTAAEADGHTHVVTAFEVQEAGGHVHPLNRSRLVLRDFEHDTKAGRVLSNANVKKILDVVDTLKVLGSEHISTKTGIGFCNVCIKKLNDVVKSAHGKEEEERSIEITIKEAMATFITKSDSEQRTKMIETLIALNEIEEKKKSTEEFHSLVGSK